MERRGPDGEGAWWSEDRSVGLGHRRLAINDVAGGTQPIVTRDVAVSVNGEFYDLPAEYEGKTDSLALVDSYQRQDLVTTLERLRGEFAFLLFDRSNNTLYAARDRFGVKPLFWARRGKEVWFASKVSALWAAGVEAAWCADSFAHAATTQYVSQGSTLFRGVHSVQPGTWMCVKGGELSSGHYWDVPSLSSLKPASVPTFREVLKDCVVGRVRKGAKTGVLLSGGIDSASVLAVASTSGEELKAYTIDFPDSGSFSEGRLAAKQAAFSQVPHESIPLTSTDMLKLLPTVVRDTEGLCVNGHSVGKWSLAQAVAKDGCKVLLSGEGADELLFGYRHFRPYFKSKVELEDPAGLGILVSRSGASELPERVPYFFHAKYHLGQKIHHFLNLPNEPKKCFQKSLGKPGLTDLEKARQCWLDSALSTYILEVLGDGAEMSHSVEGRPPFLDHTLWHLVGRSDGQKTVLREAMVGLVIEEIRQKPKHPFMAPSLGDKLLDNLQEQIQEVEHPFVDRKSGLRTLSLVRSLGAEQRQEWEPALLWVLSSYYLQELW